MMRKIWRAGCALGLALGSLLTGCEGTGTETGNPKPPGIELRFTAYSSEFGRVAIGRTGPGLSVEHAFVTLERLELLPCSPSGSSVDLAVGELELTERPQPLLVVESDETDFCRARVRLAPKSGARSAFIAGTRADGARFELESKVDVTVELASDAQTPFPSRRLLLAFNLAQWLDGVGVETADIDSGLVSIDATHQPDLLAKFDARAPLAPALYDDADGNGQLAGDNQAPAAGP
jgi:hypothetical protein